MPKTLDEFLEDMELDLEDLLEDDDQDEDEDEGEPGPSPEELRRWYQGVAI